ncbi:phosphoglycerate mutase family protein [Dendryphion nanum]|uniref:Phosphoglycerate mutase family protein n=1 Tax=Dendryphion nanum TaxID=256645 RepID=A0A9P9E5M7_9PLEO|nr:phosphoglycerate mutase family protein [Dendryphion nanum]
MLETIYFTRHAFRSSFTVDHITGVYTAGAIKHPTNIPSDPPLTSYGVAQSKELADYICKLDPPVDIIYSSPFYRCLQTLKPTTERLFKEGRFSGGKIRIENGLGEFYGLAPFTHPTPPSIPILQSHFPDIDSTYTALETPDPNGELILDLHARVEKTLASIITALDNDPTKPKTLLICSHAATMIAAGRALTGKMPEDTDEDDFQCYTASLSRFERRKNAGAKNVVGVWDCVLNSETSFLSGGPERGWKFNGEESFVAFPETSSSTTAGKEGGEMPKL